MSNKKEKPIKNEVATPNNLTTDEAAIFQRVSNAEDDWKNIGEKDVESFKLMEDPLKLPPAAQEAFEKKQFKFRWIERTPGRMDEVRSMPVPRKWWICNAANTPFLKGDIDPILGCICKLDLMLMFKPYWMYLKEQALREEMAEAQDRAGRLEEKAGVKGDVEYVSGAAAKLQGGDQLLEDESLETEDEGSIGGEFDQE